MVVYLMLIELFTKYIHMHEDQSIYSYVWTFQITHHDKISVFSAKHVYAMIMAFHVTLTKLVNRRLQYII